MKTLPDRIKGERPIVFVQPQESIPLLKAAYTTQSDPAKKLIYAHVLGLLGDNTGADTLLEYHRKKSVGSGLELPGDQQLSERP